MELNSLKNYLSSINCLENQCLWKQRPTSRECQYLANNGAQLNDKLIDYDPWERALRNQTKRENWLWTLAKTWNLAFLWNDCLNILVCNDCLLDLTILKS
jgi:hypothetical protein